MQTLQKLYKNTYSRNLFVQCRAINPEHELRITDREASVDLLHKKMYKVLHRVISATITLHMLAINFLRAPFMKTSPGMSLMKHLNVIIQPEMSVFDLRIVKSNSFTALFNTLLSVVEDSSLAL